MFFSTLLQQDRTTAHPQGFTHSFTRAETQTHTKTHKISAFPKSLSNSDFVCCKLRLWPSLILLHSSEISPATSRVFAKSHLWHQKSLMRMLLPSDTTVLAITLNEIQICTVEILVFQTVGNFFGVNKSLNENNEPYSSSISSS